MHDPRYLFIKLEKKLSTESINQEVMEITEISIRVNTDIQWKTLSVLFTKIHFC